MSQSHITDAAYSEPSTRQAARHVADRTMLIVPPHSMIAFGLFMRLPGYAEVLLKQHRKAQYLLRLVLGVADDGDGGECLPEFYVRCGICVDLIALYASIPQLTVAFLFRVA